MSIGSNQHQRFWLNIGHWGGTGNGLPVLRSNKRYDAPLQWHQSGGWLIEGWVPARLFDKFGPIAGYLLGLRPTGNQVAGATPPIGVSAGIGGGIKENARKTPCFVKCFV
jgi:hypothetical protein